jgi:ABC-type nickel/cobalt efflux system permease component RcnA
MLALLAAPAFAASPFGVGLAEAPAPSGGLFSGVLAWIALQQQTFYRELTGAVRSLAEGGSAGPLLIGLSFAYGVLHAAGPGHGKAVISAYVLANGETARNGAILAMVSALLQAASAIAFVSVGTLALGVTAVAMTDATLVLEIGSYALIAALGAWLTFSRVLRPAFAAFTMRRAAPVFAMARAGGAGRGAELHQAGAEAAPFHIHGPACGCDHIAPAASLAGPLDWRKAGAAIAAVGLRPCTGALIVLVFAVSQGLFVVGVLSVLVMAIGTGLTVAALAGLAVGARGFALGALQRESATGRALAKTIEAAGALAVLFFGVTMLAAALFYGPA